MKKITCMLACFYALGISFPAYAVNWVPLLKNTPAERFNEDDMLMFLNAAKKAINETPDGETVSWENPETKAHGSIKIEKTGTRNGQTCKSVRIANEAGNRKGNQLLDICQGKDGKWGFAPAPRKK